MPLSYAEMLFGDMIYLLSTQFMRADSMLLDTQVSIRELILVLCNTVDMTHSFGILASLDINHI